MVIWTNFLWLLFEISINPLPLRLYLCFLIAFAFCWTQKPLRIITGKSIGSYGRSALYRPCRPKGAESFLPLLMVLLCSPSSPGIIHARIRYVPRCSYIFVLFWTCCTRRMISGTKGSRRSNNQSSSLQKNPIWLFFVNSETAAKGLLTSPT